MPSCKTGSTCCSTRHSTPVQVGAEAERTEMGSRRGRFRPEGAPLDLLSHLSESPVAGAGRGWIVVLDWEADQPARGTTTPRSPTLRLAIVGI